MSKLLAKVVVGSRLHETATLESDPDTGFTQTDAELGLLFGEYNN